MFSGNVAVAMDSCPTPGFNSLAHRVVSANRLEDLPDLSSLESDLTLDAIVGIKVSSLWPLPPIMSAFATGC